MAPKTLGASNEGVQYQSMVPFVPTRATVCRSPTRPCSAMGRYWPSCSPATAKASGSVRAYTRAGPLRRVVVFDGLDLRQAAHVALLAGELRLRIGGDDLRGVGGPHDARAEAQHVDVVVLHGVMRGVGVVRRAGPDAGDLAGGHSDAGARAADDDRAVRAALADGLPRHLRCVRVVNGVRREGAEVERLVPGRLQRGEHHRLEREPGVIEGARDPHHTGSLVRSKMYSCAAIVAAPSTPACGPCRARRMVVRSPMPGTVCRRAVCSAGLSSSSPAAETPPPMTISSGSKMLITLPMPTPSRSPRMRITWRQWMSPCCAPSTASCPVISSPAARRRPRNDFGCARADSTVRRSSARPEASRSSEPGCGKSPGSAGAPSVRSSPMMMWPSSAADVLPR